MVQTSLTLMFYHFWCSYLVVSFLAGQYSLDMVCNLWSTWSIFPSSILKLLLISKEMTISVFFQCRSMVVCVHLTRPPSCGEDRKHRRLRKIYGRGVLCEWAEEVARMHWLMALSITLKWTRVRNAPTLCMERVLGEVTFKWKIFPAT